MSAEETQQSQFEDTPRGWHKRWQTELAASKKEVAKWHTQGADIVSRFLDEREGLRVETRLNLFTANIQTQQATLYGNTPKVTVGRRFADSQDDIARVAGEMLDRLLNSDIERDGDDYPLVLEQALSDLMLVGFGLARIRYEMDEEPGEETPEIKDEAGKVLAPAVPATPRISYEDVEHDYVHWGDVLWSAGARVWQEVRWLAFRSKVTRETLVEKFGKDVGSRIALDSGKKPDGEKGEDPWSRADLWEIWDKDTRQVFFYVDGYPEVLRPVDVEANPSGGVPDPLGLEAFFPCPRPMVANLTTSKFLPRPDYVLAQDLYQQIDTLETRCSLLEDAIKVAGAYDKEHAGALSQMLTGTGNKMIPVDSWAVLAEKGGIRGVVDWFPLEQIVNALTSLRDVRTEKIDLLYQVTGMADIMRGQSATGTATATEQGIKAKFGSVRMQRRQDEFARFASDLQRLKAEVIALHFSPQTILERSNVMLTPDADKAQAAVHLLKDKFKRCYRVEVKPEAVSMTDFAALKSERIDVVDALARFFQAAQPVAQAMPGAMPTLLEILQWLLSGLRGSSEIEGVLDRAIAQAQQMAKQAAAAPQQSQPDPKLLAIQAKSQADIAKADKDLQNDIVRSQVDAQTEMAKQKAQTDENTREHLNKVRIDAALKPPEPIRGMDGGVVR